jgi:DNA polymerase sigma
MSLPLNSLYIDLTNDEKLANDSDTATQDIIALVKTIVMQQSNVADRYAMIESLKLAEPFCAYVEDIEQAKERGDFDD